MIFIGRSLRESLSPSKFGRKTMGGVSYKEVEESTGLIESGSSEDEDEEIRMINGFDTALPLSDQITLNLSGMKRKMILGGLKQGSNFTRLMSIGNF